MILFFLLCSSLAVATSDAIHGSINHPFADAPRKLSIVAYSRNGLTIDVSPVTYDASFTLYRLGMHDGDYILHVLGAVKQDFDPLFVRVVNSRIQLVENRQDPLILPGSTTSDRDNNTKILNFTPSRDTNYSRQKQPWTLRHVWAYRIRFLQLAAVAFVVWFPQFIRSLPKEIREELMGETEEDLGDTTAVFRALSGYKDSGRVQSASSSSSRR